MTKDTEELARKAYDAYGAVTDHKNYQGLPMPKWEDLPPKIQEAWKAASERVYITAFEDATALHGKQLSEALTRLQRSGA